MPEEARRGGRARAGTPRSMPQAAAEYQVSRTYLEWLVSLPWDKRTEDNLDIARAEEILNADHYGLDKVKRRILDFLAVRKLKSGQPGAHPLLRGAAGHGQDVAGAIDSAGAGAQVRAHVAGRDPRRGGDTRPPPHLRRRAARADHPGDTARRAPTTRCSCSTRWTSWAIDFRGDPASALLEVLDPEQNHTFVDHYLDVAFDLSQVMFITTANLMDPIPAPLLDRMEIIELPGYTEHEKLEIAKRYLAPRQREANGLQPGLVYHQRRGAAGGHSELHAGGGRPQPGAGDRHHLPERGPRGGARLDEDGDGDADESAEVPRAATRPLGAGRGGGRGRRRHGDGGDGGRRRHPLRGGDAACRARDG